MKRYFAILLFCIAATAIAGERFNQVPLVEGHIESVDTHKRILVLSEGPLTIDFTNASIRDALNHETGRLILKPGRHVDVVLNPRDYQPGDVLSASVIQVLEQGEGNITGPLQVVDPITNAIQVNGLRIETDEHTIFVGSVPDHDPHSVAEMKVGDGVYVTYSAIDMPHAIRIYTQMPTFPDQQIVFRSTLRKIDGNTWTVRAVPANNGPTITTFKVVSGTSIQGFIRPGDVIEVSARIDGDQVTAESIELAPMQCPNFEPFPIINFDGQITAISATAVTIEDAQGNLTTIQLNDDTIYQVNDPIVGDVVDIAAEKHGDTFIARSIGLDQIGYREQIGVVKSISGNVWTIDDKVVDTNTRTEITGNPHIGDTVKLVYIDSIPNHLLALRIDKQ
jgi:hypothetical protein